MPKKFPSEFKREVVERARRGDQSVIDVAAAFAVSAESVRRWTRQADIDDGLAAGLTTSERSEVAQLRRAKRRLEQEVEILRRATERFGEGRGPKLLYPLVEDLAADGMEVRLTCEVLGFSAQAFYKWRAKPVCNRHLDDPCLANQSVDLRDRDLELEYRWLTAELEPAGRPARGG